jgi:hypothetical protein
MQLSQIRSFPRNFFTTKSLARRSRHQSLITLDSRRGAENAEKTFLIFSFLRHLCASAREIGGRKCCSKNKTFQGSRTKSMKFEEGHQNIRTFFFVLFVAFVVRIGLRLAALRLCARQSAWHKSMRLSRREQSQRRLWSVANRSFLPLVKPHRTMPCSSSLPAMKNATAVSVFSVFSCA